MPCVRVVPVAPVAPVPPGVPGAPAVPVPVNADDEEESDETVAIAINDAPVDAATADQPAVAQPDDTEGADSDNPTHPHRD